MKIHNPNNLPTIDYRTVKDFQGNLKDLDGPNHDKLLAILESRGFTVPLFLWPHDGEFFLLDGHQRQRVMEHNELSDDGNHDVPYLVINAPDVKAAKEMLLEITSQFGLITPDGLDEYAELAELNVDELNVNFDSINLEKLWAEMNPNSEESEDDEPERAGDDSGPKVPRFTIDQLQTLAEECAAATGELSVAGFIAWLRTKR